MKTITKRFLKASVAMLLVVIMLFGTTISGFAAVVDNAQTGAAPVFKCSAWNNWGGETMTGSNDIWTVDVDMSDATSGNTYQAQINYNSANWGNTDLTIDDVGSGSITSGGDNFKWKVTTKGTYTITFNSGTGDISIENDDAGGSGGGDDDTTTVTDTDLISVLKGEKIMFYIGMPNNWGNTSTTVYLNKVDSNNSNKSTLDSGTSSITYYNSDKSRNEYYTSVCVPASPGSNYYRISNSSNWNGNLMTSSPVAGGVYNMESDNYTVKSTAYTINAYFGTSSNQSTSTTITKGTDVPAGSTSSPSTSNMSGSMAVKYYYTKDKNTFSELAITSTMNGLVTSGLDEGTYYVYPVLTDGTVYARGNELTLNIVNNYTIETAVTPENSGSVTLSNGTVTPGGSITVTANPATGYDFVSWSSTNTGDTFGDSTLASTTFTPAANSTVKATFTPINYTIEYNLNGGTNPSGAVTSYDVTSGTVNLPTPTQDGYEFDGWYEDADFSTSKVESFNASDLENKTFYAKWNEKHHIVITANPTQGGTVSIYGYTDNSVDVVEGTPLTLKATANEGYDFLGWYQGENMVGDQLDYTFNVGSGDASYEAKFQIQTFSVNTAVNPNIDCTITVTDADGATVTDLNSVEYGTQLTFTVTNNQPNEYRFDCWDINGTTDNDSTTTIVVKEDITATANFVKIYNAAFVYPTAGFETIKVGPADSPEEINGNVDAYYDENTNFYLEAVVADGYRFDKWVVTDAAGNEIITYTDAKVESTDVNFNQNLTFTPYAVKICNATSAVYTNWNASAAGGSVTVNGTANSAVVDAGESITYTASANDGYQFIGWFSEAAFTNEPISTAPTYNVTESANEDVHLVALFAKVYSISGAYSGTFSYVYKQNTYTFNAEKYAAGSFQIMNNEDVDTSVTMGTVEGGTLALSGSSFTFTIGEDYDTEKAVNFNLTTANGGTSYSVNVQAALKNAYPVTFGEGTTGTGTGQFLAGKTVTLTIDCTATQAVKEIKFKTDDGYVAPTDAKKLGNNKVTFTMPQGPVQVSVVLADMKMVYADSTNNPDLQKNIQYFLPGEPVSYALTPTSAKINIDPKTIALVPTTDFTYTVGTNGVYNLSFVMPDGDVKISAVTHASFQMKANVVVKDYFDDNGDDYCKVDISAYGITDDGYVANNTVVKFSASTIVGNNQDYTFEGYYRDEECTILAYAGEEYTLTPTDNVTLYALFSRNVYIVGDVAEGEETYAPMEYNVGTDTYHYDGIDLETGSFIITPIADVNASTYTNVWSQTTVSATGINTEKNDTGCLLKGLKSGYTLPVSLTFSETDNAYKAEVVATASQATVYLSSGRENYDRRGTSYFDVDTQFIDYEGLYTLGDSYDADHESAVSAILPEKEMSVRVQTIMSGTNNIYYDVLYYYVYDIDTKESTSVDAVKVGDHTYQATIPVDGDTLIVPLFFANDTYLTAVNGKRVQIYVDASEIDWGPFVSCYPYGKNEGETDSHGMTGTWPGQLMIPLGNKQFKTSVVIGEGSNEDLSGLVFSNYMPTTEGTDVTIATRLKSKLGIDKGFIQTYDYKEGVYLYEEDYDLITYKLRENKDGYHSYRKDNTDQNKTAFFVADNTNIDMSKNWGWRDLVDKNDKYLMDLTGKKIEGHLAATSTLDVSYYVVAKGDLIYTNSNSIDSTYDGEWTVEWHVYNTNGTHLGYAMSGSMYDGITSGTSKLAEQLDLTNAELEGKRVKISYEAMNKTNYYRVDGQWYGEKTEEAVVNAEVFVGLYDKTANTWTVDNDETPNENADYGNAYIIQNGGEEQHVEISYKTGSKTPTVDLTSQKIGDYKFKGWYLKNDDGTFKEIATSSSLDDYPLGFDTEFYAFFEPLSEGGLTVKHEKYTNDKDLEILSNDGTANRTVEIWSYDTNTNKPTELISSGKSLTDCSATTEVTEGESYLIRVKADPMGADYFYAWYMDAETVDGTKTFEEVFTKEEDYRETDEVVAEFVYTYKDGMPLDIVIYSDIMKISVEAKFIYIYRNRYNNERFITKTFDMTTEEIEGFAGNGVRARRPAYKTYTILENADTKDKYKAYTNDDIVKYKDLGYEDSGTGSQVIEKLPSFEVTEAINQLNTWEATEENYVFDDDNPSVIKIYAKQDVQKFTINATLNGKTYTLTAPYNTLIENLKNVNDETDVIDRLSAPLTNEDGDKFAYWATKGSNGELEVASYSPYYWYRLIEDRDIVAVYSNDAPDLWTPSIEDVTYTREYGDGGDYIYTDYLIAFHSSADVKLEELRTAGKEFDFGLVLVRDPSVTVTADNYETFNNYPTYDGIVNDVITIANGKQSNRIYDEKNSNKTYNAYYFEFSDEPVTNFNRLVHAIKYDNESKNNYGSYAFSAYAYLIIDGETYVSAPESVNFYELSVEDKDAFIQ